MPERLRLRNTRISTTHTGLWPLVLYWFVVLIGFGFFSRFARQVHRQEALGFDEPLLERLFAFRTELLTDVVLVITQLGSTWFLIGFSLFFLVVIWSVSRRSAAFYTLAVGGAGAINQLTKIAFARERPAYLEIPPVYSLESYSFPSGHAMVVLALFLSLYLISRRLLTPHRWKVAVLATVLVVAVGFTRVYLGVHYPSDVIAGWSLGAFWVLGVNWWYRRAWRVYPHAPDPVEDPILEEADAMSETLDEEVEPTAPSPTPR